MLRLFSRSRSSSGRAGHLDRLSELGNDSVHAAYLRQQFEKSYGRRNHFYSSNLRAMVGKVSEYCPSQATSRVLCIGCRNANELDLFTGQGFTSVTGIDLFSVDPRVQVMDMHALTFPDDSFDVVFTSHSLEHALDVPAVVANIVRVLRSGGMIAIEVPVDFAVDAVDRVDFGSLDHLHQTFAPYLDRVLWSDDVALGDSDNDQGSRVVRTIFLMKK
jgi:SAM-dependent methyltransferase